MITAKIEYLDAYASAKNKNIINKQCLSEKETAVLTLFDNGTIRDCNRAAAALFGCVPSELKWQHISTVVPQLADMTLMQGECVNPQLRFFSRIGYRFDVVSLSGEHFSCGLYFNEVENFGRHCLRLIVRPVTQGLLPS